MNRELIGLIPAAGKASRLVPLPCSKELYPVGFRPVDEGHSWRPKVICHYLLEKMRLANISRVYVVLRQGKWDIPAYLGSGTMLNMNLAYLMMRSSPGAPYSLNQAYPFVKDAIVAFGFPDILFEPDDAFIKLLARQAAVNADVVLGLFPAIQPDKCDMVDLDDDGRVLKIVIRSPQTYLTYTWNVAVWTPVFTSFMHKYLEKISAQNKKQTSAKNKPAYGELIVGDVIQAAIQDNLHVEGVVFQGCNYLDIGTPDNLFQAIRKLNCLDD